MIKIRTSLIHRLNLLLAIYLEVKAIFRSVSPSFLLKLVFSEKFKYKHLIVNYYGMASHPNQREIEC